MSKVPTPRKGNTSAAKPPRKAACAPDPVAYCGPTIPGVAVQYTVYTNGTPTALAEAIKKKPILGGLVVPLDQLPEVRRQFHAGAGRYYTLYRKAQGNG